MTVVPDFYDETDGTKRFLAEYAKIKEAHNLSHKDFLKSIGYPESSLMGDMVSGRVMLSTKMLVNTKLVYQELDTDYILFSKEVPEVQIPSKKGWKNKTYTKKKERAPRRTQEQMHDDLLILLGKMEDLRRERNRFEKELEPRAKKAKLNAATYVQTMEIIYKENKAHYDKYAEQQQELEKEVAKLNRMLKHASNA